MRGSRVGRVWYARRVACGTRRKTEAEEPVLPEPVGPKPRVVRSRSKKQPPRKPMKLAPTKPAKELEPRPKRVEANARESGSHDEALLAAFAKALDQALVA